MSAAARRTPSRPLLSRWRMRARNALRPLDRPLLYVGRAVSCPCCGGRFRRLQAYAGAPNVRCPRCGSFERHRTLWLYLEREGVLGGAPELLHLAPEPGLAGRLRAAPGVRYVSADLEPGRAMVATDVTGMDFADARFDLVICCHVLEHVPNDRAAIREIFRVLRPGGRALMMHPVDLTRETTYEDPAIVDRDEREAVFGQWDHVRIYGLDFRHRLEEARFEVVVDRYVDRLDEELVHRHRLREPHQHPRGDDIYICTRPEASR